VTYLHPDHLGTPKFGTNAGGTQVWAWAPDAFGNGSPSGAATVNLRMPGQFYDAESSLFYNWNRYYNPATGRYISSDPIGLEGGINTFLYVDASPVMMIDSEGLNAGEMTLGMARAACTLNPTSCGTFLAAASPVLATAAVGGTALYGGYKAGQLAAEGIAWCINEMARADEGTCSCQHRDVHTSGGQSCQTLRETDVCGGPYKGTGSNSASCQADARENAPQACRGCLGHCNFTPAK